MSCRHPFEQPSWFYGSLPGTHLAFIFILQADLDLEDRFLCNRCTLKGVEPPISVDKEALHTYVHPLVRCKEKVEEKVSPPEPRIEDRLADLVRLQEISSTKQMNMELRLAQMGETLAFLQQAMASLLQAQSNGHAI